MAAAVLTLTNARRELVTLEKCIADELSLPRSRVAAIPNTPASDITLIIYPGEEVISLDANDIASKLNAAIQRGDAEKWTTSQDAKCEVSMDEESISLDDDEALDMWRGLSEAERTGHLDEIPNPDGLLIQPTNNFSCCTTIGNQLSPIDLHLTRDSSLLDFDNVKRVDISEIDTVSWKEPIIISNVIPNEVLANASILGRELLMSTYGDIPVRVGNRETLIDNGITNSTPMPLSKALCIPETNVECGRIVFNPLKELPLEFVSNLKQFTDCFSSCSSLVDELESPMNKYTLTLASEGFGIGMHKHRHALFMLLLGHKKWYMTSSHDLREDDDNTHPAFYQTKSSHKCLQKAGEILYVPEMWYHEIFNLSYTAGIQALPS